MAYMENFRFLFAESLKYFLPFKQKCNIFPDYRRREMSENAINEDLLAVPDGYLNEIKQGYYSVLF
jgi:hypothetical protein